MEGGVVREQPNNSDMRPAPKKCSFWLVKRSRYCLTDPIEGTRFCLVHLNHVDPDDQISKIDIRSTDIIEPEGSDGASERCRFWMQRKRRFCKAFPKDGLTYCVEHANEMEESPARPRIPCIYDPRHSCYKDQLDSHLKKCNSRPSLLPEFYQEGINSGRGKTESLKVDLMSVDMKELNDIISSASSLHKKCLSEIRVDVRTHGAFDAEFNDPSNGTSALKHLKQQASLVGHMCRMGFMDNATTYVEFGAGRGGLSHWVQLAGNRDDCRFILVDKSSVRNKKDSHHKRGSQGPSFERIKINIQDLILEKVPRCLESGNEIFGIGKHLCGNATDFMLRCLMNCQKLLRVGGIVLATCCHHRCEWDSYAGRDWFLKQNLDERFFQILVKISAWATCGTRHATDGPEDAAGYVHPRYGNLKPEERERIGFLSKNLIDHGRVEFIRENGLCAELVQYVTKDVTLESFAIIAHQAGELLRE